MELTLAGQIEEPRRECLDLLQEAVIRVAADLGEAASLSRGLLHSGDQGRENGRGRHIGQLGAKLVPPTEVRRRQRAQSREGDLSLEELGKQPPRVGLFGGGAQPLLPELVEDELGAELIELPEGGIDARFDGPLAQQPGGEGVDRRDLSGLELGQGLAQAREPRIVEPREHLGAPRGVAQQRFELAPHALAQLARGLLGERDGHHLVDGRVAAVEQAGDEAVDEHARLARARARLDQEGGGEIVAHATPHGLVSERRQGPPP